MRAPRQRAMLSGLVGAVALFGVASCSTTVAPVPSQPAYDIDVRPILMAHCVRCHGAGDALNVPTKPTGPDAAMVQSQTEVDAFKVLNFYLDRYSNDGMKNGAFFAAGAIASSVSPKATAPTLMPPAPAARLDDWEVDVLTAWSKHPICSTDPDPDPAVCPNGPG